MSRTGGEPGEEAVEEGLVWEAGAVRSRELLLRRIGDLQLQAKSVISPCQKRPRIEVKETN